MNFSSGPSNGVQKVDDTIHRINLHPVDSATGFPNTYPLDSDLSCGKRYPSFEQLEPSGQGLCISLLPSFLSVLYPGVLYPIYTGTVKIWTGCKPAQILILCKSHQVRL